MEKCLLKRQLVFHAKRSVTDEIKEKSEIDLSLRAGLPYRLQKLKVKSVGNPVRLKTVRKIVSPRAKTRTGIRKWAR